jgi:hypothetical protein
MSSKILSSMIPEHDRVLFIVAARVLFCIRTECALGTILTGAPACSGAGFGGAAARAGAGTCCCSGAGFGGAATRAGAGTCCGGATTGGSNGGLAVPDKFAANGNVCGVVFGLGGGDWDISGVSLISITSPCYSCSSSWQYLFP